MIRKATLKDIDRIIGITKACANCLIGKGIHQWNKRYPNKATFKNDVLRGELYAIE